MSRKLPLALFLLLALAGLAWLYRGEEPLRRYLPAGLSGVKPGPAASLAPPAPGVGLRKCKQGSQVLYTNGDCPKGASEQAIKGGTVTVVPGAQEAQAAPAGVPAGVPTNTEQLGKMMGKQAAGELRDKSIDRATGK